MEEGTRMRKYREGKIWKKEMRGRKMGGGSKGVYLKSCWKAAFDLFEII